MLWIGSATRHIAANVLCIGNNDLNNQTGIINPIPNQEVEKRP